ncbi:MAG: hypothetical protein HOV79_29460 [Hamadaea sp.]|nr:hypothetical protein [Hamadaea sp.]
MASGVRRKGLGWAMFFAALAFLVSNLGTALVNWLTTIFVTPIQTALISTAVGLAVVFIGVFIDYAKSGGGEDLVPQQPAYPPQRPGYPPAYQPPPGYRPPSTPPRKPVRRTPWAVAIVLMLVLCGGGGFAATVGVQWAFQKGLCFFDPVKHGGAERLGQPRSKTAGPLTVHVTNVETSECGVAVRLRAVNEGDDSLTLPVYGNAHLTIPGETSRGGEAFLSKWDETVPPGGELIGYVVFRGDLPASTTEVTFSFSTIFGTLGEPRSISVEIPIKPPPVTER